MDRLILRAEAGRSVVGHQLGVNLVHIGQSLQRECGVQRFALPVWLPRQLAQCPPDLPGDWSKLG